MDYHRFSVEDFIKDEYFQQWVYAPTAESEEFWKSFSGQNPDKIPAIQEARQFLTILHFREEDIFESRINAMKSRIDQAIDSGENGTVTMNRSVAAIGRKKSRVAYYAAAATIAMILVSTWILLRVPAPANANRPAYLTEVQLTPKGKRTLITLEDGTRVWLNAESTLNYPKSFSGAAKREVFLEGEGFFDVAENKDKPFIVHTSELDIRVLGTAFNVRSYQHDKKIETTLVRGKVMIESYSDTDKQFALAPSQQAVFDKVSKKIVLSNQVNTDTYTGWKEGRMIFVDQPLKEIVAELERWYNVTIQVDDNASLRCRFSANINNKTLPEVLELFKASDGIDYRIAGSRISITGTLCED